MNKIVSFIGNRSLDDVIDDLLYKEFIDDIKFQADISVAKPRTISNEPQKRKEKVENGSIESVWPRDPGVAKESLVRANFLCEINSSHSTFKSNVTKENYVEAHHLIPMHSQVDFIHSLDVPGNIVPSVLIVIGRFITRLIRIKKIVAKII
ncbi:hypothetical protein [Sporosarcina sp. Te-1]|uniref:hypothetical protein n=1 Tax=Sporosarcina sp. Te-1 TaxID=2818390 RepID=UPI001FB071A9|nr:hypothetical protein [Sporosarcina sp. Te-1]